MALSRDKRRRWLGGICLAVSAAMLILGQTVLKDRLPPMVFIYYWLTCTIVTGLTLLIAVLDLRAVRLRSQREQRELMNDVLREIERKTAEKENRGQSHSE